VLSAKDDVSWSYAANVVAFQVTQWVNANYNALLARRSELANSALQSKDVPTIRKWKPHRSRTGWQPEPPPVAPRPPLVASNAPSRIVAQ